MFYHPIEISDEECNSCCFRPKDKTFCGAGCLRRTLEKIVVPQRNADAAGGFAKQSTDTTRAERGSDR